MKRALITGVAGQDGSYLAELLVSKGYTVFGLVRPGADLEYIPKAVQIIYGDMADEIFLRKVVQESRPDEVYNLGGVSDLKTAYADPVLTMKVNYDAVRILLDEAVKVNAGVRFLQASSSEIFIPRSEPLDEHAPRDWGTKNPYAQAKMLADRDVIQSAQAKGVFACSAFLFNHESIRRHKSVTTKIIRTLRDIKEGKEERLTIGNVDMYRDWGFAGDYVRAMWNMLQLEKSEDFVVATGQLHSVKECIEIVSSRLGVSLAWHGQGADVYATDTSGSVRVKVSPEFYRIADTHPKVGDTSKAQQLIGWKLMHDFRQLIIGMVDTMIN